MVEEKILKTLDDWFSDRVTRYVSEVDFIDFRNNTLKRLYGCKELSDFISDAHMSFDDFVDSFSLDLNKKKTQNYFSLYYPPLLKVLDHDPSFAAINPKYLAPMANEIKLLESFVNNVRQKSDSGPIDNSKVDSAFKEIFVDYHGYAIHQIKLIEGTFKLLELSKIPDTESLVAFGKKYMDVIRGEPMDLIYKKVFGDI